MEYATIETPASFVFVAQVNIDRIGLDLFLYPEGGREWRRALSLVCFFQKVRGRCKSHKDSTSQWPDSPTRCYLFQEDYNEEDDGSRVAKVASLLSL